jgi:hypothetical protein
MDEILGQLVDQLGTHPGQTEVGAGALLNVIREHASQGDFSELLKAVPEAAKWMGTASAAQAAGPAPGGAGGGGGGLLGELGGLISGLSGSSGGAGGLIAALSHSGLSAGTLMQLVPMLLSLLQQRGGSDLVAKVAGSVPMLQEVLGGGGGATGADGTSSGGGLLGELGKMFG